MSFDIYFLTKPPGGSWEDSLAALEDDAVLERPLTEAQFVLWRRLEARLCELMPEAEVFDGETNRELTDEASGIQVSLFAGELSLSAPYWYSGPEAHEIVAVLRRVASVIEEESGLTAYDPQAEAPFLDDDAASAERSFETVARSFSERGITTGDGSAPTPKSKPGWQRLFRR